MPGPAGAPAKIASGPRAYVDAVAGAADDAARAAGGWIVRDLAIAGTRLRLRFAGPGLLGVLLPPLAHLLAPGRDAGAPAVSLAVWDSESTGIGLPPVPWTRESLDVRGHVRGFGGDGLVAYHNAHFGGITLYDAGAAAGVYWVDAGGSVPWYERGSPLRTALHLALPGPDRHLVHAGAVGGPAAGILIGGRSGSGKSTAALACLEAGLGYAGDDYVLVSLRPRPVAHCLYGTAKVDPSGLRRLPGLADCVDPAASSAEKAVLDLNRGRPDRIRTSLPVTAVVLPRVRGDGRSELRPMPPREALRALAPSTLIQMPHRGGEVLETIGRLVRAVPSYRLELGGDPAGAVRLLRPLLGAA